MVAQTVYIKKLAVQRVISKYAPGFRLSCGRATDRPSALTVNSCLNFAAPSPPKQSDTGCGSAARPLLLGAEAPEPTVYGRRRPAEPVCAEDRMPPGGDAAEPPPAEKPPPEACGRGGAGS